MAEKLSNIFFEEINRLTDADSESVSSLRGNSVDWAKGYFRRTTISLLDVDEQQEEIEILLSKIDHQPLGLVKRVLPAEELLMNLKFYYIAWGTLKDLVARFMAAVLDLGIADVDLNFGVLLRNEKIRNTRIPEICGRHNDLLDVGGTDKARNEAVHRGRLVDDDVADIRQKKATIRSARFSLLTQEDQRISEEEYKRRMKNFYDELRSLVDRKRNEYQNHYELTMELNKELAIELAGIWHQFMKGHRL